MDYVVHGIYPAWYDHSIFSVLLACALKKRAKMATMRLLFNFTASVGVETMQKIVMRCSMQPKMINALWVISEPAISTLRKSVLGNRKQITSTFWRKVSPLIHVLLFFPNTYVKTFWFTLKCCTSFRIIFQFFQFFSFSKLHFFRMNDLFLGLSRFYLGLFNFIILLSFFSWNFRTKRTHWWTMEWLGRLDSVWQDLWNW